MAAVAGTTALYRASIACAVKIDWIQKQSFVNAIKTRAFKIIYIKLRVM